MRVALGLLGVATAPAVIHSTVKDACNTLWSGYVEARGNLFRVQLKMEDLELVFDEEGTFLCGTQKFRANVLFEGWGLLGGPICGALDAISKYPELHGWSPERVKGAKNSFICSKFLSPLSRHHKFDVSTEVCQALQQALALDVDLGKIYHLSKLLHKTSESLWPKVTITRPLIDVFGPMPVMNNPSFADPKLKAAQRAHDEICPSYPLPQKLI